MGDGMLVMFNDPIPCADHTEKAVRMAVNMRESVNLCCERWQRFGHDLGFGMGIARGHATIGRVGFANRSDYTVIGSVPNLAARLCEKAKPGQILLSQRACAAIGPTFEARPVGEFELKGFHRTTLAFEIV